MPAAILERIGVLAHSQVLGIGLLEHPEQPLRSNVVLLLTVNADGAVRHRTPEQVPGVGIGGVDVAAGIDDHRLAVHVVLEPQQVVVLVVAEPAGADDAVGDQQIVARVAASR